MALDNNQVLPKTIPSTIYTEPGHSSHHPITCLFFFFSKASLQNKKAAISALMKEAVVLNIKAASELSGRASGGLIMANKDWDVLGTSTQPPCTQFLCSVLTPILPHLTLSSEVYLLGWSTPASLKPLWSTSLEAETSQTHAGMRRRHMDISWNCWLTAKKGTSGSLAFIISHFWACIRHVDCHFLITEVISVPFHFHCEMDSIHWPVPNILAWPSQILPSVIRPVPASRP